MHLGTRTACLFLAVACASTPPTAVPTYLSGRYVDAIDQTARYASKDDKDAALQAVRLASMSLATGDLATADRALVQAVQAMQDFRAEGEFRAKVGEEASKEWKGEPYEKMMAFLYLGLLRLHAGDDGNALAMGKSAALADAGTIEEQYTGDFVAAQILQGLAFRALGEERNTARTVEQAVDLGYRRALVPFLQTCADRAGSAVRHELAPVAVAGLLAALPRAAEASPRSPVDAARQTRGLAIDMLRYASDVPDAKRPDLLQGYDRGQLRGAIELLGPIGERFQALAGSSPDDLYGQAEAHEADLRWAMREDARVVLWVERGRGPRKTAVGQYEERLVIEPTPSPRGPPEVIVDGVPSPVAFVDSVTFQATTRGGRKVDGYLEGKAVFKTASAVGGVALLGSAFAVRRASPEAAGALALAGVISLIASAATQPRADTRGWELLPHALWLASPELGPGTHALVVDGRTYTLQVSDAPGPQVHLIPALPPGGASVLSMP